MIKKYKMFASDVVLNMIAFAIYTISQQVVLLPVISKMVNDDTFSTFLMYISVFNIIANVCGGELGIVRQVKNETYEKKKLKGDFSLILLGLSFISGIVSIIALIILKYNITEIVIFTIIVLLANIRLYAACYFRLRKEFKKVIVQNLMYLIGVILGLVLFNITNYIWLPMLCAEAFSFVYTIKNINLLKEGFVKTSEIVDTVKTYINLGFISLLTNLMTYFDKFLIYPILGAKEVNVYYASTAMSKVITLVINPVYGVILSWLSGTKNSNQKNIINLTLKANIPLILIAFIASIPLTYITVRILYSQYLEEAMSLIIPACIAVAFATATTITRAVLLKYVKSEKLVIMYILYFAIFIILALIMSTNYGLIGFAYANVIAKIQMWISYIILLYKQKNVKGEIKRDVESGQEL